MRNFDKQRHGDPGEDDDDAGSNESGGEDLRENWAEQGHENRRHEGADRPYRDPAAGTTVRAEFILHGTPQRLPPEWDENLLRIGQEVLTNVLRHAQASHFKAQIAFAPDEVRLDLRDNGCGFDPAVKHDGFGLLGMRERVEGMGGHLTIQSANGEGAAILITLPLADNSQVSAS